jgi:MFS family permease
MRSVATNLWKLTGYKFLGDFLVIVPIIVPFYRANGLNATQILVVQAAFSLAMLLFEVPSGYLSDAWGRRKTLMLGAVCFPLGMAVYSLSGSFAGFIVAETVLALAYSMRSGTDSATLYDTLLQLGRQDEYRRFEGRMAAFERLGAASAAIIGGAAALVFLRLPFYINIVTGLLLFAFAFSLIEPKRTVREAQHPWRDIVRITGYALAHRRILAVMLYASLVLTVGIISIWGYFLQLGRWHIPLFWYGVFFTVLQLSSAAGARFAHRVERLVGERGNLFLLYLIALILFLVGGIASPYAVVLAFPHAFLWGTATPLFLDMLNRYISSDMRATVLSVSGMLGRLTYVVIGPLFGLLADKASLSWAFAGLGMYFTAVGTAALFLWFGKGQGGGSQRPVSAPGDTWPRSSP